MRRNQSGDRQQGALHTHTRFPPTTFLDTRAADGGLRALSKGSIMNSLLVGVGISDRAGPDLTPRAKVDGLEDAIAIIRAAWAAPIVRYHGSIYSVDDLDLEPKPAQPIPIWLGALGPRGLALTGRLADGWIPFLRFAGPDRIPELLDQIRTASVAAGPRTRCAPSTASPSASTRRPAPPPASSPARPPTSPNSCTASPSWASPALTSCPAGTRCAPSPRTSSPHCANCRHPRGGRGHAHRRTARWRPSTLRPGRAQPPPSHQTARHQNPPAPPPDRKRPAAARRGRRTAGLGIESHGRASVPLAGGRTG